MGHGREGRVPGRGGTDVASSYAGSGDPAYCVTSAGGESPAEAQRRGDMGRLRQMNEWVNHPGEGPSCHPAPRQGLTAYKTNIGVHRRSSAVKKPRSAIGLRLNRRFHRGTQMILGGVRMDSEGCVTRRRALR